MMTLMLGRVFLWGGAVATVAALVGLGVYFVHVGLDDADKLASVIGLFVAVAGLVASLYGLRLDRRRGGEQSTSDTPLPGERSITIKGDNTGIASTGDNTNNIQLR